MLTLQFTVELDGVENIEGRNMFFFGRFVVHCHSCISFFVFEQIPGEMSARRDAPGCGVNKKIGRTAYGLHMKHAGEGPEASC